MIGPLIAGGRSSNKNTSETKRRRNASPSRNAFRSWRSVLNSLCTLLMKILRRVATMRNYFAGAAAAAIMESKALCTLAAKSDSI